MKQYVVSKDVVDAFLDGSWEDLEDFYADDSWGSDEIVQLPPNARVLTREEFEKAYWTMRERVGKPVHKRVTFKELADELFGSESE